MKTLLALVLTGALLPGIVQAQQKGCAVMSITKLHADHPLTKAGLIYRRTVQRLEVGAEPGDVVFQFQHGRIVHRTHESKNGYGMFDDGIVPKGVSRLEVHKEFLMAQAEDRRTCGEKK